MNKKYVFYLGHQPHISAAEIKAVFSASSITPAQQHINTSTPQYLFVETEQELNCEEIMQKLGGTIKIMEDLNKKVTVENIASYLDSVLPEDKIHFSLSGNNAKRIAIETKKKLKADGRSVRYIEPKNTATILHNNLVVKKSDLTIIDGELFVTRAIQPMEEFGERDFGRPGRDDKSGMLPPKLARIMINLSGAKKTDTVLDPFCGSGTILMETLLMGFDKVIGSDISPKAVDHTEQNLEWLLDNGKITTQQHSDTTTLQLDVSHVNKKFGLDSVDSIIFEPHMGKPLSGRESKLQLKSQASELALLYKKAFKSLHKVLKKNGSVTCIIPKFRYEDEWVIVDCLEAVKKNGFEIVPLSDESDSLLYHRKKQHVGRDIWRFKKIEKKK